MMQLFSYLHQNHQPSNLLRIITFFLFLIQRLPSCSFHRLSLLVVQPRIQQVSSQPRLPTLFYFFLPLLFFFILPQLASQHQQFLIIFSFQLLLLLALLFPLLHEPPLQLFPFSILLTIWHSSKNVYGTWRHQFISHNPYKVLFRQLP